MKKGILLILLIASSFYASAQSKGKYQIKFLEINKQNSDYGVAILDNNKLVFTSSLEKVKSKKSYNPRKDLYIGDIDSDGEVINIKPVSNNKDTKFNQTGVTYTSDKKTVYFSRNLYVSKKRKQKLPKNQRLELYKASVNPDGSWSNIEKLPFNKSEFSTGYPVLNKENTKLYFVSDRLPNQGKSDIFVVNISKDGKYSKPRNLGKNVNTAGVETTPFITEDDILYFSSDGHPGKGKLDVFAVEVFENSTSEVYPLISPINSINDDFSYIINKDKNLGFFTSNRLQGKDNNDLYSFTLEREVRPGACFISVEGKVKDSDTKETIAGASVELYNMEGRLLESISTYNDGSYKFTVSCAKEYKIIASNDNYVTDEKHIEILEENYHATLHTNLNLNKIKEDKVVVEALKPIYYDFDDASIKDEAAKEMDKIVRIMTDNPDLMLEASAFTDSRGSSEYNRLLSKRRAKAAMDYIISKGIDKTRVKGVGYGEKKLRNQCINGVKCDEHLHQLNRRTEFNFSNHKANVGSRKAIRNRRHDIAGVNRWSHNKTLKSSKKINSPPPPRVAVVKPKKVEVPEKVVKVKPEVKKEIVITDPVKPKAKTKTREVNIAENFIEDQKGEIVDKLELLERKYEDVISEKSKVLDSAIVAKQRVTDYKKSVESLEVTGWSNIISYKVQLKKFNQTYERLTSADYMEVNAAVSRDNKKQDKNKLEVKKKTRAISIAKDPIDKKKLRVRNIEVVAIKVNENGIYSETKNADQAELIKVSFKIKKNKYVNNGNKDAHIVIHSPKGTVSDVSGVFVPKNTTKEKEFTNHATIEYDFNDVNVVIYIERKSESYDDGLYPVEVFLEGELVATSNLDLGNQEIITSIIK